MKNLLYFACILFLFSCKKEGANSRVDIYLLKSFSINTDQTTTPYTQNISNAVLEDMPFVKNEDIDSYEEQTSTFILKKDIKELVKNYGSDKAFAVTIDNKPVYYGKFHSIILSSMMIGLPTIVQELTTNSLKINYIYLGQSADLKRLDKRNDQSILKVLKASHRLR